MKLNIRGLKRIEAVAKKIPPKKFNMEVWLSKKGSCGTTGCVIGHFINGLEGAEQRKFLKMFGMITVGDCNSLSTQQIITSNPVLLDGLEKTVEGISKWLRLSPTTVRILFGIEDDCLYRESYGQGKDAKQKFLSGIRDVIENGDPFSPNEVHRRDFWDSRIF